MKLTKALYLAAAAALFTACANNAGDTGKTENQPKDETPAVETKSHDAVVELGADDMPVAGKTPVVIDCWATWCGPCMQFKPVYHAVAKEYAGKATFMAADMDICEKIGKEYGISAIPTVIILKEGQAPVLQTGSMNADEFKAFLDKNL